MEPETHKHHHHIIPVRTAVAVGAALLFLTAITVWVAHFDLGKLNFPVAMLIATGKASLVALIFMNLKYDNKENAVIFSTSFLFLAIFLTFTVTDLFFRGDVYVKGSLAAPVSGKSKFKKAWVATPELITHGKALFQAQCASCHGAEGKGDGAAAGALNPRPRNFTSDAGWKNGRKPSQVFKTMKEGIPGSAMASYATLPLDDRWGLVHYVNSLGGPVPADTPGDLAKVGIDPSKETAGDEKETPTVPVEFAMKRMVEEQAKAPKSDSR